MDDIVKRIKTSEKCLIFAKNCREKGREDLAHQAKERSIQIRAEEYGTGSLAEKESIEAILAYEESRSVINGKKTRANRTWPMVKEYGIIQAVEKVVIRPVETQGYKTLIDMGLQYYAFEAVILRHPEVFSSEAIRISQERIEDWESYKTV